MKGSRNDQRGNIKMGGAGGGGIGAVVLLGGALATAAFASVFVLGQKRRSSDKDRRQKSEKDEANKGQEIITRDQKLCEHEHIRKEVEVEKDSTIKISVDEEAKVSERVGEVDDGFVIVKEEIPLMAEVEKVESVKEEISDHHLKEKTNLEQVSTEDKTAERESDGGDIEVIRADVNGVEGEENVNMEEKKCVEAEASGRAMVDLIVDEVVFSETTTLLQTDSVTVKSRVEEKTAVHGCMVHAHVTNHVEVEKTSTQQISPEEVEVVKYVAVEAAPQNVETEEEMIVHEEVSRKDGDEESDEVIETKSLVHTSAETNRVKIIMDCGGDKVALCSEENSKWEDQWQGETKQAKGMSNEVGGKIQEDYSAFTNKDEVMRKEHPSNSTRWRVMIWTLSVLSSLSCSWYLDLSPAKLCLVVFLTVFLLEIYGYPLLKRKPAQCLHSAEGERVYEERSLKK